MLIFYSEAIEASYKSIELSEASGDYDGVLDLYVNLYEIYRYTENKDKVLETCKKISELLEKKGDMNTKANYDKQYSIIEKGEPLNRMIIVIDGINFEMDGNIFYIIFLKPYFTLLYRTIITSEG